MVYNNLGSRGPGHLDEPPVIRLDRVGRWHGQDLDVVVALIGHAHYEPCGENGLDPAGEIVVTAARWSPKLKITRCFPCIFIIFHQFSSQKDLVSFVFEECRPWRWPSNRKQTWRSPSPPTRFSRAQVKEVVGRTLMCPWSMSTCKSPTCPRRSAWKCARAWKCCSSGACRLPGGRVGGHLPRLQGP